MVVLADERKSGGLQRRLIAAGSITALIAMTVALLYGPVVKLPLTGDSYQWVQHAHAAAHRPALLLADLDTFLRPSTTWTLVIDRFLWGGFDARGFRATSLVLHGFVALALVFAGRRLGLGPIAASVVAVVWVTSPFTDESAFVVAYRFQPLLLLAWLVLIAVWPETGAPWNRGRILVVVAAVLAAAAAKETWVVTPALIVALEVDRGRPLSRAVFPGILAVIGVALYVVLYFVAFPTSKSYYELGPHILAKIPRQLAAFLYVEESNPLEVVMTWTAWVALAVVVVASVAALQRRVKGTWVALSLLVLPTLPTLLVPFMPQRYLAIPYAGFLLLIALCISEVTKNFPRFGAAIRGVALAAAVLAMVAGSAMVRADLQDYRAIAAAHEMLLEEAADVATTVAAEMPVVVARAERANPLVEILRDPKGMVKLPYTRHQDPYGLIDTAALFEWVIADEEIRVERIDDWATAVDGAEGSVVVHEDGGFAEIGMTSDVAREATRWQTQVGHVRVVRAVPLD